MATKDLQKIVKIGPAVPEICSWTDRHTDRQIDHNTPLAQRSGVMNTSTLLKNKHSYQDDCGGHIQHRQPSILLVFYDLCAK